MSPRSLALALLALLVAGCSSAPDTTPTGTDPPPTPHLPPKGILSKQGNNDVCTEVLSGSQSYPFEVEAGYDTIEVTWHANGLGQVGFDVKDSAGNNLLRRADENPGTEPCDHNHTPESTNITAPPGRYEATVRNAGIIYWLLTVNERQANDTTPGMHH